MNGKSTCMVFNSDKHIKKLIPHGAWLDLGLRWIYVTLYVGSWQHLSQTALWSTLLLLIQTSLPYWAVEHQNYLSAIIHTPIIELLQSFQIDSFDLKLAKHTAQT